MRFRLSDKTKSMLAQNQARMMNPKPKWYYNSKQFYQRRPDLAPRDVYLYEGRTIDMEKVKKYLDYIGKESILERAKNAVMDFLKSLIKR